MNRFIQLLWISLILSAVSCPADTALKDLRCEYLTNPLGIDATNPRLSWILDSNQRGEMQKAYQVLVASSRDLLGKDQGDIWDSGKVSSDESTQIAFAGAPLASRQHCFWKVRAWDQSSQPLAWSQDAEFEMGLLQPSDWHAQWISGESAPSTNVLAIQEAYYEAKDGSGRTNVTDLLNQRIHNGRLSIVANNRDLGNDPAYDQKKQLRLTYELDGKTFDKTVEEDAQLSLPDNRQPLSYLRKSFTLKREITRAELYATALGLYEFHINGHKIGDHFLAPDWTDYRKRVRYQVYDVTPLVKTGDNAMGALVANGWYSGHIGNGGYQFFGKTPAIYAQLAVTYSDGATDYIVTDTSWKNQSSPVLDADFMYGDKEDARLAIKGWDQPGLNDGAWTAVAVHEEPDLAFDAQVMEPVREVLELKPKILPESDTNRWVYDFGQNMVGVVRLKMNAPAGTQITLRHAEMLNTDGTIYTNNLRGAPSVDTYVCAGGHSETWQPRFTFHGFRYVEISGLNYRPSPDDVTGVVIASDNRWTGKFTCSDTRLNQLQSNIQWGQRGNYISIPTDCPQRDERLGWMGDAEIFVRTATYNADVASFFTKWMVDVDDGQQSDGSFGDVSPNTGGGHAAPAWGDAGVICPWTIYQAYGDKRILEQHLPAMMRWIQFLEENSHDYIRDQNRGGDFGDWLAIGADTSKELIGTAFFAHSADLVAQSCAALGRTDDADKYQQLFQKVKTAFNQRYVTPDGHVHGDTQCGYILALKFDLLPEDLRPAAAQYLADDIRAKGNHLSTGFVGVSHLLPALANAGKADVAGDLLRQDTFPSWLFSVKHGATTIWERWDGWTPEKGFEDPGMNSFNHYSLGSCGQYLFEYVGGIQLASPGFKTIRIAPVVGCGLTWADTSFRSDHGLITTAWNYSGNQVSLKVSIPANTTATVQLPADDVSKITESGLPLTRATGVSVLRQEGKNAILNIQSGSYDFVSETGSVN